MDPVPQVNNAIDAKILSVKRPLFEIIATTHIKALFIKALFKPFGILQFYLDDWGAYERHLGSAFHPVGKQNTQKIERKHLTLRTRIKRLVRKTISFLV